MPTEKREEDVPDEEFEDFLAAELDMTVEELRARSDEVSITEPWEADVVDSPE